MGRLPEAWIAPPATRELRGWVRHRAKLVGLRSSLKCQVHAVLAGAGVQVPMSDLFGASGRHLLATTAAGGGVPVPGRLAAAADHRAGLRDRPVRQAGRRPAAHRPRLPGDPADPRGRAGAGRGVRRRDRRHHPLPPARSSWPRWAGLTPKHHESDTTVHRGRITKQGSRLVRWAAVEAVQRVPGAHPPRADPRPGRRPPRPQHRRRRRRPRADRRWSSTGCATTTSAACPPDTRARRREPATGPAVGADRGSHDPRAGSAWSPPLIDLAHREPVAALHAAHTRRRDDRQPPPRGLSTSRDPGPGAAPDPHTRAPTGATPTILSSALNSVRRPASASRTCGRCAVALPGDP